MRKLAAALALSGLLAVQTAAAAPLSPTSASVVGRVNNQAVLGIVGAAGAADTCAPEDKNCVPGKSGGVGAAGVVLGVVALAGIGAAVGGGSKKPTSP